MNVDFRVEVSCESLVVIVVIIVYDIKIVDFVEVMFSCICCVNVSYIWIKVIVKKGYNVCVFKFVLVSLLLWVFKFCFVFRFVIGGV